MLAEFNTFISTVEIRKNGAGSQTGSECGIPIWDLSINLQPSRLLQPTQPALSNLVTTDRGNVGDVHVARDDVNDTGSHDARYVCTYICLHRVVNLNA